MSSPKPQSSPSPLVAAVHRIIRARTASAVDRGCSHLLALVVPLVRPHCRKLCAIHHADGSYGALELACDAVSEAALTLRRNPTTFTCDAEVVAYCRRCASRLVLRAAVRGGDSVRAFGIDVGALQLSVQQALWPSTTPTTARDRLIRTQYVRALRALPRRQRQTLRLVLEQGATLETVCGTLGISIATAYRAKRAGLQTLRLRLLPLLRSASAPKALLPLVALTSAQTPVVVAPASRPSRRP